MPTFRSKPRTITAEQFKGGVESLDYKIPTGACFCAAGIYHAEEGDLSIRWHVHTMHGKQTIPLLPGDWVVLEPDGTNYYPIKDDVMKANYELVKEDEHAKS